MAEAGAISTIGRLQKYVAEATNIAMSAQDTIYDLGMHEGQDSHFYLKKGFRVVAVEADPTLCRLASTQLSQFVSSGQLTIVNAAITEFRGQTIFYRSALSDWSTVVEQWHRQNEAHGHSSEPITVEAITLSALTDKYGPAFYMKIDIEGMDRTALQSLATTDVHPPYISIETAFGRERTLRSVLQDLDALGQLGYNRFKIVDQSEVPNQIAPMPPRTGIYVPHTFVSGSSGLFGEEAPGQWVSREEAVRWFRSLVRRSWLATLLHKHPRPYGAYCHLVHRLTGKPANHAWFDIHAKHSHVGERGLSGKIMSRH